MVSSVIFDQVTAALGGSYSGYLLGSISTLDRDKTSSANWDLRTLVSANFEPIPQKSESGQEGMASFTPT